MSKSVATISTIAAVETYTSSETKSGIEYLGRYSVSDPKNELPAPFLTVIDGKVYDLIVPDVGEVRSICVGTREEILEKLKVKENGGAATPSTTRQPHSSGMRRSFETTNKITLQMAISTVVLKQRSMLVDVRQRPARYPGQRHGDGEMKRNQVYFKGAS